MIPQQDLYTFFNENVYNIILTNTITGDTQCLANIRTRRLALKAVEEFEGYFSKGYVVTFEPHLVLNHDSK